MNLLTFASPWFLLALLFPVCYRLYCFLRRPRPAALPLSSLQAAIRAGRSWRIRLRWLPDALQDLAFALLVIALARPQSQLTTTQTENASEGIAIEMVMDRSASMFQEMPFNQVNTTRLEAVKKIFSLFVFGDPGNRDLPGREGDLIGLVTFAKTAETNCPLTLGHDALQQALDTIRLVNPMDLSAVQKALQDGLDLNATLVGIGKRELYQAFATAYGQDQAAAALNYYMQLGENNYTAIGDALALGIARLKQADADENSYKIKSKVLILLTDGENNHGREIASVSSFAREAKVKIHVIALGNSSYFSSQNQLKELAAETQGTYTVVDHADELLQVYRDIDALERSQLTDVTFINTTEEFQPYLLAGLGLLVLALVLKSTLFQIIP